MHKGLAGRCETPHDSSIIQILYAITYQSSNHTIVDYNRELELC